MLAEHPATCSDGPQRPVDITATTCTGSPNHFLAGQTRNSRLSLLVTGVTYRHPALLAKIITTLDVLSGGRAMLGLGATWLEREHHALGVPYPPIAERFERLEETLQICKQTWSDDNEPYTGKHYQLAETMCSPLPIQKSGPPVMIGGMGEKKTLRLVAKCADACSLRGTDHAEIARKLTILKGHCDTEGTDYDRIEKTVIGGPDALDDTDGFLREMEGYAKLGIDTVWNGPSGPDPAGWMKAVTSRLGTRLGDLWPASVPGCGTRSKLRNLCHCEERRWIIAGSVHVATRRSDTVPLAQGGMGGSRKARLERRIAADRISSNHRPLCIRAGH